MDLGNEKVNVKNRVEQDVKQSVEHRAEPSAEQHTKQKPDIKIIIAAHKKYRMPQDDIYIPLHVGAEGKAAIGYQKDNTGDNISSMNPYFCELTGMYWMWKNLKADYLGLAHYRRHFCLKKKKDDKKIDTEKTHDNKADGKNNANNSKWLSILSTAEAQELCEQYEVIVPSKRHYYIESIASHYAHTHYNEHLYKAREIIDEHYPQYLVSYDRVLKQKSGYMFNMFIMRKALVNDYCQFLFGVLFELDKAVDTTAYTPFQARYPGRVGEILFNVWLDKVVQEQSLKMKEIGCLHMEPINWLNKGLAFLMAKFMGKRYEHGF